MENDDNGDMDWDAPHDAPEENPANPIQPPEHADQIPRNADGSLDGGVAVGLETSKSAASECELMLFLECSETLEGHENHPVISPGVTVCIGLDKVTKLAAVFQRYVSFANEHAAEKNQQLLQLEDIEFVHCSILDGADTSEASALMKNDRIKVQRIRRNERATEYENKLIQREADRNYFDSLRNLMTDFKGGSDIILDCRGKLADENGFNQEVLRTTLRGHSAILSKRCKWLKNKIQQARIEFERKSVVTVPEADNLKDAMMLSNRADSDADDGIEALPYPSDSHDDDDDQGQRPAAEIEIDEDDDAHSLMGTSRPGSPVLSSSSGQNMLWVTIENHPPEAVKLLLEYCYTNSVISLGQEAFEVAWNEPDDDTGYTVSFNCRRWPDNKRYPRVSFATALAGIALAEEANLPRLSLMCEVAASQLLGSSAAKSAVTALCLCTQQEQASGNPLKRLRKAVMKFIIRRRGVDQFVQTSQFAKALEDTEISATLIPSLLRGLGEAVAFVQDHAHDLTSARLRERSQYALDMFEEIDREDMWKREMERRKYRPDDEGTSSMFMEDYFTSDEDGNKRLPKWTKLGKRSLKRSLHPSSYSRISHVHRHHKSHKSRKHPSRAEKWVVVKKRSEG